MLHYATYLASRAASPDMTMTDQEKLVRDRIPEIVRERGMTPSIRYLPDDEYGIALKTKAQEELDEYLASGEVLELLIWSRSCKRSSSIVGWNGRISRLYVIKSAKNGEHSQPER